MSLEIGELQGNLVDGQWVARSADETIPVANPSTLEVVGHVPDQDEASSDGKASEDWRPSSLPPPEVQPLLPTLVLPGRSLLLARCVRWWWLGRGVGIGLPQNPPRNNRGSHYLLCEEERGGLP